MTQKIKKRLNNFDKFILLLNCLASFALLLSYLASVASPQHFWLLAIFGLIYPLLFLINCLFIIYWLIRKKRLMLIPVLSILIGFKILTANFGFRQASPLKDLRSPEDLRMMAYNVHCFLGVGSEQHTFCFYEMFKLINNIKPDIISIEEFYVNPAINKQIYSNLKKMLSPGNHYFKSYTSSQWDSSGVAIYSKYPIIRSGPIAFPDSDREIQAIYADLKYKNDTIRVYSLHLQSTYFGDQEHEYLQKLSHSGKVSLHESKLIGSKLKIAFIKRSYQVMLIRQHMAKCPYPFIVAGDFNDTPSSYAVNQIGSGLKNAFTEKGSGLGITYYGDFPNFQIDYIMASPRFDIINYQAINKKLSDHYPIVSDLLLNEVVRK